VLAVSVRLSRLFGDSSEGTKNHPAPTTAIAIAITPATIFHEPPLGDDASRAADVEDAGVADGSV